MIREARHWERATEGEVQCNLCPHLCLISASRVGLCGVRVNRNESLCTTNYGKVTIAEPITAGQLPHFGFGRESRWLGVGGTGCSMKCPCCNTWRVSQGAYASRTAMPQELIDEAKSHSVKGLAVSFSEPAVWFEYLMDTLPLAQKQGLGTLIATNGMIRAEPLRELLPYLDGAVIGFKGADANRLMSDYGAWQDEIWNAAEIMLRAGISLEASYLVVPGQSERIEEFREFVSRLAELGDSIPLHLIPYEPAYLMEDPALPATRLHALALATRDELKNVHVFGLNGAA